MAKPTIFYLLFTLLSVTQLRAQDACTGLGQTPSSAFPVCGTTTFHQGTVPLCGTASVLVPGCPDAEADGGYKNKNPYFYKFTCYVSGTLGFVVTPLSIDEDYDWQLWDITGRNPDDVFTDLSLFVTANWSGSGGPTGASATGVNFVQCASIPGTPTFAAMPQIIAGHQYLLMISHYTPTQSGYDLSFGGGTGVITDPAAPHMQKATANCDGQSIILKLNKKMKCSSLTGTGTEFSLLPAAATVVSAVTTTCSSGFDFDSVTITLSNPIPSNNYMLVINNGGDGNTLMDNCDLTIPVNEQVPFQYIVPQPIYADSIGKTGCAPDSVRIYFPKRIKCSTIAANGSDFTVSGPFPVTVISAGGNCIDDKTDYVVVRFSAPVYRKGTYQVTLKPGTDGTTVIDECGQQSPTQTLPFVTVDTVSALFTYTAKLACREDELTFTHDGAHDVNTWNWLFNNTITANTQTHIITFPSTSDNNIQLIVSNGVCSDTASQNLVLDNEVKAGFEIPEVLCPEDPLLVKDTSLGIIDNWRWMYDVVSSANGQSPPPYFFPNNHNREAYYFIKLIVSSTTLNCSDSTKKYIRVLNNCYIGVPTAFTPNGDGLNDYFWPHNALKADHLEFKVYNRWGQLVFASTNWMQKWDGKIKGTLQASGVYVWFLSYINPDTGKPVFEKGTVMLIR